MEQLEAMQQGESYMPQTDKMTVFKTGVGVIEPTEQYTDEEVVRESEEMQKPVEHPAVVCMDERRDMREPQPVREKVAGGNLNTLVKAAAAVKWSGFSQRDLEAGPDAMLDVVADFLVKSGETLGAHRHAHDVTELELLTKPANNGRTFSLQQDKSSSVAVEETAELTTEEVQQPKKTGCGAIDNGAQIDRDAAEHSLDEEWVEAAKTDLGDIFNIDHWSEARAGYAEMAGDAKWQTWDHGKIQDKVEDRDGVVEVLDANSDAFAEDIDGADQRHGHWGQAARINHEEGKSNDRDNARIPFFQVDVAPIVRMATAAGANKEEASLLLHAEVMRQYATTYRLTKNMRIVR